MNWNEFLKSKFFWLNLIAVFINLGQYFLTTNLASDYAVMITLIIGALQVIANSIAGANTSVKLAMVKVQLKAALKQGK